VVWDFVCAVDFLHHTFGYKNDNSVLMTDLKNKKQLKPTEYSFTGNHGFRDIHQIVVIGICHIELACCEFRVVRQIDAFVTELSSNFVDSIDAANHKHLKKGHFDGA
jgi:hypothetical protein